MTNEQYIHLPLDICKINNYDKPNSYVQRAEYTIKRRYLNAIDLIPQPKVILYTSDFKQSKETLHCNSREFSIK